MLVPVAIGVRYWSVRRRAVRARSAGERTGKQSAAASFGQQLPAIHGELHSWHWGYAGQLDDSQHAERGAQQRCGLRPTDPSLPSYVDE